MNLPRQSFRAQPVTDTVQWRLLDIAYGQPATLWTYLLLCIGIGGLAVANMRDVWSAGWACFGIGLAVARLVDWHHYRARKSAGQLILAQRWFSIISSLQGVYWGLANLVLLLSSNTSLQFWIINAETAVLGLAVARVSSMAAATTTQVAISTIAAVICCLLSGNAYFQGYGILTLLYLFAMMAVIKDLNDKTVRLLTTEERNAALLQSEGETNARLEAANRRLETIATTDGLTDIPNRRCFDYTILREWGRATRAGTHVAVLLIDIDHFKSYNDTLGHLAGDICLCRVARSLAGILRGPSDLAARYGGEEFAVILANADLSGTIDIAERLRATVEEMALPSPSGGPVTVSIGVALCKPVFNPAALNDENAMNGIGALIAEADANLYEAKGAGRNCVRASRARQAKPSFDLEAVSPETRSAMSEA